MPDTIKGLGLVVGATGTLGGVIARRLLKAGVTRDFLNGAQPRSGSA